MVNTHQDQTVHNVVNTVELPTTSVTNQTATALHVMTDGGDLNVTRHAAWIVKMESVISQVVTAPRVMMAGGDLNVAFNVVSFVKMESVTRTQDDVSSVLMDDGRPVSKPM